MRFLLLFLAICGPAAADDLPAFDAATIKPSSLPVVVPGQPGGTYRVGLQMDASGLFRCSYCSLQTMIGIAWDLKPNEVVVPDWATSQSFAVEARMPAGTAREQALLMFRNLVTTRFQMHMTVEERPTAVYSLVVAQGGLRMKATNAAADSVSGGTFEITASAMPMTGLARRLSAKMNRPVIDETGLAGDYEIRLTWGPDGPDGTALDNLFRALREQLGLDLRSGKSNMKVYVVDKALKTPVEN